MIGSLIAGAALGAAYFHSLWKTSLVANGGSFSSGLFWGLGGFFFRFFSLSFVFLCLQRFTALHVTGMVVAFMVVFLMLLFQAALKIFLSDRPSRRSV